jgi:Zn-dependent protease
MDQLADALTFFAVFLFSTTLHEAAHAWAALKGGDPTAYHGGQVTLDPLPHIRREPFGMVVLPLASALLTGFPMGFASAPYDPAWARRYPNRAAWMALAGPAANLVLVLLAAIALRAGVAGGVFYAPHQIGFGDIVGSDAGDAWRATGHILGVVFSLNLLLATLNLIPLPPLDGSAVIMLLMGRETKSRYQGFILSTPWLGFVGMLAAFKLFPMVFAPVLFAAVSLLYPGASYG